MFKGELLVTEMVSQSSKHEGWSNIVSPGIKESYLVTPAAGV